MYDVIKDKIPQDKDYPDRYYDLFLYKKVLEGSLYDCFKHGYHVEYLGDAFNPTYNPETERSPSVTTGLNIMRSVVDQSVGFLFGENRFPTFRTDETTKEWIDDVVKDTHLVRLVQDAATKGSIGSVAVEVKVLNSRFFPCAHDTVFLTPVFDPKAPDILISVTEKRKVSGRTLVQAGYDIDPADLDSLFWFHRVWDDQEELIYLPYKVKQRSKTGFQPYTRDQPDWKDYEPRKDETRSVMHGLGLVPFVWIRNLPGSDSDIDGRCTFEAGIENCVQIDYALSRADRALRYNADPLMVIKTRKPNELQDFVRGDGTAMVLPVEGDAKLLQISGDAAAAILQTVDELKDEAMQAIHGSRADPDKLATSNSSVAQRMLYLPMVQLASHLRVMYGDCGLIPLIKLMMQIAQKVDIYVLGKLAKVDADVEIQLDWNDFFPATPFDLQQMAQTMTQLTQAGIMSKKTALANLRKYFDYDDLDAEMAQIESEQDAASERDIASQTAIIKAKPAITNNNSK